MKYELTVFVAWLLALPLCEQLVIDVRRKFSVIENVVIVAGPNFGAPR